MSYLVLHMDKFKKEAVRGIQSHNERERESHSNPDIDYKRSEGNYELHEQAAENYTEAIQNRIDDLLLVKAVRKDAVHMCGLIVSSDTAFFQNLSPEDTKRFFEESKDFLTEFVGKENVISAMVHMDEKTPHMHFLHVPVTEDGRLNANKIYTRESLKKLQTDLPQYLQEKGFVLQRGVEQTPDSAKKHLNTREFKQQQEAVKKLEQELDGMNKNLEKSQLRESELQKRLQSYEAQAQEAEKILNEDAAIPDASLFNYKAALEKSQHVIEQQKKALASKHLIAERSEKQEAEIKSLHATIGSLNKKIVTIEAAHQEEKEHRSSKFSNLLNAHEHATKRLEELDTFLRWDFKANELYTNYQQEKQKEAQRKAAEQRQKEWERAQLEKQLQAERERQAKEQEQQKAQELERQKQEQENRKAQQQERRRGMGMGR